MAFTIRSLFNRGPSAAPDEGSGSPSLFGGAAGSAVMDPASPPPMNTSPFGFSQPSQQGFGGTLFKTADGGPEHPPMQPPAAGGFGGSPFAPTGGHPMLTVGDVLPLLPPDLARPNSLPPGQPINLPPEMIESALTGGRGAIPVFEIYRVCPALFQAHAPSTARRDGCDGAPRRQHRPLAARRSRDDARG